MTIENPNPNPNEALPPAPLPPKRRRRPLRALIALLAAAVLFAGGYWYFHGGAPESQSQAAVAAPVALPVTVAKPLKQQVTEWQEFTGQFEAVDSVEIRARVSGYLDQIDFEDGQMVKQGDLLFVIDPRPFKITLASAKSALNSANARLQLSQQQLGRAQTLRQKDFTSQATLDQRQQETKTSAADVQVAQAAIDAAQLNLIFTQIEAPVSGRIGAHQVSIGNLIAGGDSGSTTPLAKIVSLDPIRLSFDMSESDFLAYQRRAAEGKMSSQREADIPVEAKLTDEADWTLKGKLDFVNNEVDRTAGTIRVRGIFPNADLLVTPGQFGRIRIPGSESHDAILIPDSAIVSDQSHKVVLTVSADGTVVPKPIRPGPTYGNLRIVREGLTGDETIVIDGLLRARPGGKVAPQPGQIQFQAEN